MPDIQSLNDSVFIIDSVPKQRGAYEIVADGQLVGIRMADRDGWVKGCELQAVANYNNGAFADTNALLTYLQSIMFL